MQFEILNTIYWVVGVVALIGSYEAYGSRLKRLVKRKHLYLGILITTIATHSQFYTLTEVVDVVRTQEVFKTQKDSLKGNKVLTNYLDSKSKEDQTITNDEATLQELIQQEQLKSKQLAAQIETKTGENE